MITMSNLGFDQLGAQMGQYAMMHFISRELNVDFVFFREFMNKGRGIRLFEPFNIPNRIIEKKMRYNRIYKYLTPDSYFIVTPPPAGRPFDDEILHLNPRSNYDIRGSFGSFRYWRKYADEIYTIFTFKTGIQTAARSFLQKLRERDPEAKQLVSMHFRRTDYLKVASLNLSNEYYKKALSMFCDKRLYKILVFSDDIEFCKGLELLNGINVCFVDNNNSYVDMCIMSLCNHNIIANSSFSLWGALLNRSDSKKVICPKTYAGPDDTANQWINGNYYPSDWVALDEV